MLQVFDINHKSGKMLANITAGKQHYDVCMVTDAGDDTKYNREYETSSSLIINANVLLSRVNYLGYLRHTDVVKLSVQLGWAMGFFINMEVDVMKTKESDRYEFIMLCLIYAMLMFNKERQVSDEEEAAIKEVMDKQAEFYDVGIRNNS